MNELAVTFPAPLGNLVVIKNPVMHKRAEMEKTLKTLPESEKEKYLIENMVPEFDSVEVLAKGPKCSEVEIGKNYAVRMDSALQGRLTLSDMKHLYIRETEFFAVW